MSPSNSSIFCSVLNKTPSEKESILFSNCLWCWEYKPHFQASSKSFVLFSNSNSFFYLTMSNMMVFIHFHISIWLFAISGFEISMTFLHLLHNKRLFFFLHFYISSQIWMIYQINWESLCLHVLYTDLYVSWQILNKHQGNFIYFPYLWLIVFWEIQYQSWRCLFKLTWES